MIKRLPKILRSHRRFAPSQQAAGYSQIFRFAAYQKPRALASKKILEEFLVLVSCETSNCEASNFATGNL